ncbi:MAG TPA: GlsB/YeaQ/YmgE family stress response membrane protein [Candidatus Paceibacterota bacterium]|nr:GlsB/YeaQ/YmgE family stress response membrane protein [Candidatus Paceibacterota bacterium]
MNILLWIIFGGIAGWLASVIMGSDVGLGIVGNIIVGIIGAFIGGWIADKTGIKPGGPGADRPTDIWGFVWAVVGAIVLLFLINLFF